MTVSLRQNLAEAADRLQSIMTDKRRDAEAMIVTGLLGSFYRAAASPQATDMLLMAYDMALEDAPTWAVEEAARRWNSGRLGPKTFAPTPPELRCAADEVVLITKGKIASLRWLAKAEVVTQPTPEMIARAATLAEFIKGKPMPEDEPLSPSKTEGA